MKRFTKITLVVLIITLLASMFTACGMLGRGNRVQDDYSQYYVIFKQDANDLNPTKIKFISSGVDSITMPKAPTKDGYIFLGWFYENTDTEFTDAKLQEIKSNINLVQSSITVVARFALNKALYHINFSVDGKEYYSINTKNENEFVMPTDPVKDGYDFVNWVDKNTHEIFDQTELNKIKNDKSFYNSKYIVPVFNINTALYHVIFTVEGVDKQYVNMLDENPANVKMPQNPSKPDYGFIGWYIKGTETKFDKVDFDALKESIKTTRNSIEVVARFKKGVFTITFDNIFDDGPYFTTSVDPKEAFVAVEKPIDPVHAPCTFVGWYADADYSTEFDFNKMPTDSMTIYAKWDIPNITITFDKTSCGEVAAITKPYNSPVDAPIIAERYGFVFCYFYILVDGEPVEFTFNKMPKNDVMVYVKWKDNNANVQYLFGDKVIGTLDGYILNDVITLDTVKPGSSCYQPDYKFQGWYKDKDFTQPLDLSCTIDNLDFNIYGKFKSRTFFDEVDKFHKLPFDVKGTDTDPIIINNTQELSSLIDYVTTFEIKESNMKYFKIKMLEDNNYTMEALKLEIDKAYKQSTSVNFGISYGCTNNIACICVANEAGDIKDVTQNPTIDNQIMSGVLPVVKSTRPPAFDNFKYKEYPLFDREITTSNQLFYVLQYGYQPKIVDKFSPAQKMLDEAKKALKECIDPSMDDFDKLYAIYCWMVMNVSYDHQALKDNAAEEEKENHYYSNTCEAWHMEGVFNRHLAVCDGISKAMVLMCRLEGIPCIRVTGPGHAWNKVYIDVDGDGKGTAQWYSLDATWGDLGDGANSTNLDISSFLYKDVDKNNDDGPMPCENHLDIVADTNIDVYENINFEINGQTYDLFMPNKEELDIFITYCHNFINANSSLTTFSIGIYVDMTLMTTPKSILDAVHAGLVYVENKKKANDIDLDCKNCIPITDNKIILIFTKL